MDQDRRLQGNMGGLQCACAREILPLVGDLNRQQLSNTAPTILTCPVETIAVWQHLAPLPYSLACAAAMPASPAWVSHSKYAGGDTPRSIGDSR